MFIIYDLIFIVAFILYFSILLVKGKVGKHFLQRFGLFLNKQTKKTIWLHAVSVGEVNCLKELSEKLKAKYPDFSLVVSTVTPTGNKIAKSIKAVDYVFYLPFDLSFVVSRFIKLINPKLVIITETEFWPNFIYKLHKNKIPIVIVNGRISDRSYKKYNFFKFLFKNILLKISLFCMQTENDARRLMSLGVAFSKVKTTGNMKFDIKQTMPPSSRNLKNNELLFVAASTHYPEEKIALSVYKELAKQFTNLRLLIAPRHIERFNEIKNLINLENFSTKEITSLEDIKGNGVFLVNTIGILGAIYSMADIVFVGGSLIKKGGQNILEPAFFAKPIIIGQYYFNFSDIVELFKKNNAIIIAKDNLKLEAAIRDLIINNDSRNSLGIRAKELLINNQGASAANLELIKGFLN